MNILNQHISRIRKLCELNNVKILFAFGSVTRDHFGPDSDIDLIVEIDDDDPVTFTEKYFSLKFQPEDVLKRPIYLLEHKALRNRFLKKEIDGTKNQVYGK